MAIDKSDFDLVSIINADTKLGDMAAKIALNNFDFRFATLLFFNASLYYGVEVFLRTFNNNLIVNYGVLSPEIATAARQFVLFGSDLDDLEQLLETMKLFQVYNTGKFIVICQARPSHECNEKVMVELFWEHKIVNIIYLREEMDQAVGYTYYPITENNCRNINPVKLNASFYKQKIYKNKFANLHLCPLIVSTFKQVPYMMITNGQAVGADGDLIPLIEYALNTKFELMLPHRGSGWGYREANGTWMGSLADVYDDLANLSMTSAALTSSRYTDFQISNGYCSLSIVWITHPAKFQNVALKLLHPFESDARIALLISFLLVLLCAYIMKTDKLGWLYQKLGTSHQPMKSIVFYSWMICMGQSVAKLPTKSVFLQITFMWIFYCCLIRTAYQVYLISSLKGRFYENQFETIEDAIKAEYSVGGGAALKDYYIDYPMVYDKWISIDTTEIIPTVLNISKGMKFVLAMNLDTVLVILKTQKVSVHILPQKILVSPNAIFFKKYSPLKEPVSEILNWLTESGFADKIHRVYTTKHSVTSNDSDEKLKIIHFTACYVILVLGYFLSAIFFLLELYFGKYYKHPAKSP